MGFHRSHPIACREEPALHTYCGFTNRSKNKISGNSNALGIFNFFTRSKIDRKLRSPSTNILIVKEILLKWLQINKEIFNSIKIFF